jgi:hypothetical protein
MDRRPELPATQEIILSSLQDWLHRVGEAVENDATDWRIIEQDALPLLENLRRWLQLVPSVPKIAPAPNA